MRSARLVVCLALLLAAPAAFAGEGAAVEPKPAAPPIPFHSIEGKTGVFITDTAYFANMPEGDSPFGKPSVGLFGFMMGHKHLYATSLTTNVFRRIELGYSYIHANLGDWATDVEAAVPGVNVKNTVGLHTVSARAMLLRDGEFDTAWMPAVTLGVSYKNNNAIWDINRDLGGLVNAIGVNDNDGWDVTLMASKIVAGVLPKPFLVSAGLRSTRAHQIGLLGFGGDRDIVFEGNMAFFITDRLLIGAEYRQKPDDLNRVGKLVGPEHDWWTVAAAYIVNSHLTVAAAYGHLGNILNHEENAAWALQAKWEF